MKILGWASGQSLICELQKDEALALNMLINAVMQVPGEHPMVEVALSRGSFSGNLMDHGRAFGLISLLAEAIEGKHDLERHIRAIVDSTTE